MQKMNKLYWVNSLNEKIDLIKKLPTPTIPTIPFPMPKSAKQLAKKIAEDENFKTELEEIILNFWQEIINLTMKRFKVNQKTAVLGLVPILTELQAKYLTKAFEEE